VLNIDNTTLATYQQQLKMLRQVIRLLLGNLNEFDINMVVHPDDLSLMDKHTLLKLHEYLTNFDETNMYELVTGKLSFFDFK